MSAYIKQLQLRKKKVMNLKEGVDGKRRRRNDPIISLLNLIKNKINLRKRHKTKNVKEGHCLSLHHRFSLAIAVFQHLH